MKWSVRLAWVLVIGAVLLSATGCAEKGIEGVTQGQRMSAHEAWKHIQPVAEAWKANSLILECRPPSRPGKEDLGVDGLSSAWRFIVAPEGDGNQAFFSLDTTAQPIKPNRTDQARPAAKASLNPADWKVDSPQAMEIALANGLQDFIDSHDGFQVKSMGFEIDVTVDQGAYWMIKAKDGADTFELKISCVDGSILP
ncbi:MAG: hypothetical protein ACOX2L_01685 [Anaerolineae bacterium]|jgi:hypothetical protein|nr:hypothetical protein [Chloroflexota bacterium]